MTAISDKLIERLTLYHGILSHTVSIADFISSTEIATLLHLDDSQVRKDIAFCEIIGRPKYGYPVSDLKKAIEKILAFQKKKNVFIIGAGNLGSALTKYNDFKDYGIEILALFDNMPDKIGQPVNGKIVFSMDDFEDKAHTLNVDTVILTVPPQDAQSVTDFLIKTGIKFIWNFSPCILRVPPNITVHYENIISGFLKLKKQGE